MAVILRGAPVVPRRTFGDLERPKFRSQSGNVLPDHLSH